MQRRTLTQTALALFGSLLLVGALAAPVAATGGDDHDGDADRDRSTSYTEDNDTNDAGTANNVVDDGDNAHPSGRDRSVERFGNQGRSESDPDDDGRGPDRSNGGPDKPNGSGGVDAADQDGNNGCGNDDDFEDDNEGWCGHKPTRHHASPAAADHADKPECEADMSGGHDADSCDDAAAAADDHEAKPECEADMAAGHDDDTCDDDDADDAAAATADDDDDDAKPECEATMTGGASATDDDECEDTATAAAPAAASTCEGEMTAGGEAGTEVCAEVLGLALEVGGTETTGGAAAAVIDVPTGVLAAAALPASTTELGTGGGLAAVAGGALAFTGANTLVLLVVALAALAAGVALVRISRRRSAITA